VQLSVFTKEPSGLGGRSIEGLWRKASLLDVCKYIWMHHEQDLRSSERLMYTWQYDVRWAATQLRKNGKMRAAGKQSDPWGANLRVAE